MGTILGGLWITQSKRIGHQGWQTFGAIALQTACAGAMSTASLDNPAKSIVRTVIISTCTSLVILNSLVIIGFGILYQEDIGTSAGLAGTARLLFGAIATAIFSNVTNNKYGASCRSQLSNIFTRQAHCRRQSRYDYSIQSRSRPYTSCSSRCGAGEQVGLLD